jgi:hypothetical protein
VGVLRVLFYVLVLAAMIYAIFWAIGRRNATPPSGPITRGPVGPDDDEDFLRELDRKRRRRTKDEDG